MSQKFMVLDPTAEVEVARQEKAPRRAGYQTVGVLDNGKSNALQLLQKVAGLLQKEKPELKFVYYRKPELSKPAPPAMLDKLAQECEVALIGIGD